MRKQIHLYLQTVYLYCLLILYLEVNYIKNCCSETDDGHDKFRFQNEIILILHQPMQNIAGYEPLAPIVILMSFL